MPKSMRYKKGFRTVLIDFSKYTVIKDYQLYAVFQNESVYDSVTDDKYFTCGKYFTLGFDTTGSINLNYCPEHNTNWNECGIYWDFHIPFRLQHWPSDKGIRKCVVKNNSKLGKAVCANLAGFECSGC